MYLYTGTVIYRVDMKTQVAVLLCSSTTVYNVHLTYIYVASVLSTAGIAHTCFFYATTASSIMVCIPVPDRFFSGDDGYLYCRLVSLGALGFVRIIGGSTDVLAVDAFPFWKLTKKTFAPLSQESL